MAITASIGFAACAYSADHNATLAGFSYEGEYLSRVACFFVMTATRLHARSLSLSGFRHLFFSIMVPFVVTLCWFYSVIYFSGREYRFYTYVGYFDDPFIVLAEYGIAFVLTEMLRQLGKRTKLFFTKPNSNSSQHNLVE